MIKFDTRSLTDRAAFLADWTALNARCSSAGFFQSPAWMTAWLGGAPEGAALHKVEARRDGELLLLGVFAVVRRRPPVFGMQEVWFQEFGEPALDAVYAEYADFLVADAAPDDIRAGAVGSIIDAAVGDDAFVFRNLRPEMTEAAQAAAAERKLAVRTLREQPVYVCDLSAANFEAGLSKSLQTKISRSKRLYEERGVLSVRKIDPGDGFGAAWAQMVTLHKAGWEARGGASVFDNRHLSAFHERLRGISPGSVHLFEVKAGNETIAVLYNFVHGDRVMNYQSGFLYEVDNRLAPGFTAHAMAAQFYAEAGFRTYDLLAGEAGYKQRLGTQETTLTSLVVERPTWRNRLRRLVRR